VKSSGVDDAIHVGVTEPSVADEQTGAGDPSGHRRSGRRGLPLPSLLSTIPIAVDLLGVACGESAVDAGAVPEAGRAAVEAEVDPARVTVESVDCLLGRGRRSPRGRRREVQA